MEEESIKNHINAFAIAILAGVFAWLIQEYISGKAEIAALASANELEIKITESEAELKEILSEVIYKKQQIDDIYNSVVEVDFDAFYKNHGEKIQEKVVKTLQDGMRGGGIVGVKVMTKNGPYDDDGVENIDGREIKYNKLFNDSDLRVSYTDNFYVYSKETAAACRWEIKFNGESCDSSPLIYDHYVDNEKEPVTTKRHYSSQVLGYCSSLPKNEYNIRVNASPHPGNNKLFPGSEGIYDKSDCITGYSDSTWTLEVMEILSPSHAEYVDLGWKQEWITQPLLIKKSFHTRVKG